MPSCAIDLAHPFRIAAGEVVVDGDDMHALAGQRVQIGREGRDQGLALARLHFGDVALVQEDAAHQLHVEGAQTQRAARGLAAVGEGFGQHGVQAFAALLHALLELGRLGLDPLVAQRRELRLQRVDLRHQRPHRFDLAVIRRPEDFPRQRSKTQHIHSARAASRRPSLDRIVQARDLPQPARFPRRAGRLAVPSHVTMAM